MSVSSMRAWAASGSKVTTAGSPIRLPIGVEACLRVFSENSPQLDVPTPSSVRASTTAAASTAPARIRT